MLKKLLREIDRLEQSKTKKVEQIKMLQDEVNKIDEELKPYYTLKKQYEKFGEDMLRAVDGKADRIIVHN